MSAEDELEEIRQRKREELRARMEGDGEAGSDGEVDAAGDASDDEAAGDAAPSEPIYVEGTDHLQEIVDRRDVVLVDFYADWCGPCQMMEPAVERIAAETEAAVAKVDADAHQALAARQGVRGLPTVLLYADGEQVERLTGAQSEAQLRNLVEHHV